jgi:tetratricopeptide (TPR) repeat protein
MAGMNPFAWAAGYATMRAPAPAACGPDLACGPCGQEKASASLAQGKGSVVGTPTTSMMDRHGLRGLLCPRVALSSTNAYIAALDAGDTVGVIQSLLSQANDYHMLGRYSTAVETVEQALRFCSEGHDQTLVRTKAHLLGVWADNAMMAREYATARMKLDAVAALLDHINSNEQFDRSSWYQLRGKYAYVTGDYAAAAQWYEQALRELPAGWTIRQVLVLMPLLSTYTALQDRDASLMVMEKAAQVIPGLNAPLMVKPLSDALQGLVMVFPHEARIKMGVADLLQHIRRSTLPGMASLEPGSGLP